MRLKTPFSPRSPRSPQAPRVPRPSPESSPPPDHPGAAQQPGVAPHPGAGQAAGAGQAPGAAQAPGAPHPAVAPGHPGVVTGHPGVAPAHPGVAPGHPGVAPGHPGVAPAHPGVAPRHPGEARPHSGAAPAHPGVAPPAQPPGAPPHRPGAPRQPPTAPSRSAVPPPRPAAPPHPAPAPPASAPAYPGGVTPPSRRGGSGRFLTDVIVALGFVDASRVRAAEEAARRSGQPTEQVLVESGTLSQDQLARATAERFGLDHLDLTQFTVDMGAANLIGAAAARRYEAVPIAFVDERTLLVAMADPANVLAVDDIAIMTGFEVRPAVASREDLSALVQRLNRLDHAVQDAVEAEAAEEGAAEITDLREVAEDAPVIKLVHSVIAQAAEQGASDIHFEPEGKDMRVRFRIDGVLHHTTTIPRRMVPGAVSRIKIMAELDIAERRVPQDGRVSLKVEGRQIDVRVVTLPSVHGESVVMRILDKSSVIVDLDKLGLQQAERERFQKGFSQAFGAVLVTGPTGSGKSTSLYGALQELNTPEKNIITIEDPVEYQIAGLTQVQVNPRAGLTFANGLRSMMRADPDIIMVGEIRDRETAQIAVEAALTGHLVLSTLHTNDAAGAMTRLIEMGIEPFLVSSAIDCVVAQRLARTLCSGCKRRALVPASVLEENGFPAAHDLEAFEPGGCPRCAGTGYKGRVGVYEVMAVTEEIRRLVLERSSAAEVAAVAREQGMRALREEGLEKVRMGITSLAEISRVTGTS
jgi:type IV pilus assembly protein PilB